MVVCVLHINGWVVYVFYQPSFTAFHVLDSSFTFLIICRIGCFFLLSSFDIYLPFWLRCLSCQLLTLQSELCSAACLYSNAGFILLIFSSLFPLISLCPPSSILQRLPFLAGCLTTHNLCWTMVQSRRHAGPKTAKPASVLSSPLSRLAWQGCEPGPSRGSELIV